MGYPFGFIAEQNALLPLMNFIEDRNASRSGKFVWRQEQDLHLHVPGRLPGVIIHHLGFNQTNKELMTDGAE